MLKTISAALLAASVIAAPAFAAEAGKTDVNKTTQAPVIKSDQTQSKLSTTAAKPQAKVNAKSDMKADAKADTKAKAMNANAAITPNEHHKVVRVHRHHHKHLSANKQLKVQPATGTKQAPTAEKRS